MIKTSLTVVLLAIGCTSYAYAQNALVSEAISQDRQAINETRTAVNKHQEAIDALRKQVAANQSAPLPALEPKGSVRYDRAIGDCKGFWIPSADKQKEIDKLNSMPDDGYNRFVSDCRAKRTAEEFAAEARRAQQQAALMPPPPAPGAIQDDESEVDQSADDASPQQAGYRRGGYDDAAEVAILQRRARRMLGERGIEGAYSFQSMQRRAPPRPGCVLVNNVLDRSAPFGYARWHCPRNY